MGDAIWHTGPNGALATERGEFRLLVEASRKVGGTVRFLVVRKGEGSLPDALIRSGNSESVRGAMEAAERMAARSAAA
jgi:hypothetical protein